MFIKNKLEEDLLFPPVPVPEEHRRALVMLYELLVAGNLCALVVSPSGSFLQTSATHLPALWAFNRRKSVYAVNNPELVSRTKYGDDGEWLQHVLTRRHLIVFTHITVDHPGLRRHEGKILQILSHRKSRQLPTVLTAQYSGSSFNKQSRETLHDAITAVWGAVPALMIREDYSVEDFPFAPKPQEINRWPV